MHDLNWHSNTVKPERSAAQAPQLNHANKIGWTRVFTSEPCKCGEQRSRTTMIRY